MSTPPSPVPAFVATAATQPLIVADNLDAPLAWRDGAPISRRHYLADVHALAARLPAAGPMLNFTADRYRFAVGLGAAMLRGQASLMPPNHTTDTVARLHTLFPSIYALTDADAPTLQLPTIHYNDNAVAIPAERDAHPAFPAWPEIDDTALAAQVLTSGSTGAPVPHAKHWGLLVRNTQAGARRLVFRAEQRLVVPTRLNVADVGFAGFAEAGRLWAERMVPYSIATPWRGAVGVSVLAAVPPRSRRMWRVDFALPISADPQRRFEVRFASVDRSRVFWNEPRDVQAGRERTAPSSLFTWP